jgi:hypothetical protein
VPLPRLADPHLLHVAVFGPGQGESIVVRAGDAWVVVDSARLDAKRSVAEVLLEQHAAAWTALVLTHKHSDHIRGFRRLLDQRVPGPVACRLPPERPDERRADGGTIKLTLEASKTARAIEDLWAREPATRWDLRVGLTPLVLPTGNDASPLVLEPLWPPPGMAYPGGSDGWNRISTPMRLTWNAVEVLLGADLAGGHWPDVAQLHGHVSLGAHAGLKVAHHASANDQHLSVLVDGRDRCWVVTPFTNKRLPDPGPDGGLSTLLAHVDQVRVTSLPFPLPSWRVDRATVNSAGQLSPAESGYESAPRLRADPEESWWHVGFAPDAQLVVDDRGDRAIAITA